MADGGSSGEISARQRSANTKKARTRQQIIDAAVSAFVENGWAYTRIEEIVDRAGVSATTFYKHFENRYELIAAGYQPVFDPVMGKALRHLARGVSPVKALGSHLDALARMARQERPLTVALLEAVQEASVYLPYPPTASDPRVLVPLPVPTIKIIEHGQRLGAFEQFPVAADAGAWIVNGLMLRVLTRPSESAALTARIAKAFAFGALKGS